MTSQIEMDMLCNAAQVAHSELPAPPSSGARDGIAASSTRRGQRQTKRARLSPGRAGSISDAAASPSHVCHLCRRIYERADHLTRHMRSHENARQYQCSTCPKRFNRADLLNRHETTHDREGDGKERLVIRRNDRAAEACVNCSTSKAKCDDQKPCSRCKSKNLTCQTPARKIAQYRRVEDSDDPGISPPENSTHIGISSDHMRLDAGDLSFHLGQEKGADVAQMFESTLDMAIASHRPSGSVDPSGVVDPGQHESMTDPFGDDMMMFFSPVNNLFLDVEYNAWNLDFNAFLVPELEPHEPSPQSTGTLASKPSTRTARDLSKGHAAFKESPWLWEPGGADYVRRDQEGLQISEETIGCPPAFGRLSHNATRRRMNAATRDRVFAVVLAGNKDPIRTLSFPSLELLNYLIHVHFLHDDYHRDSWIHSASFNPDEALPELLVAVIAHGASFISVPAIWQFGLAMQEVVRQRVQTLVEYRNSYTRNLRCLRAYMLNLDMGMWSGFKRKTELSESFLQPLTTMLRRAGVFSAPADFATLIPTASDPPDVLEAKWAKFITRESYKRMVIHLFTHDVQSSITLQKNPLISFSEFNFDLPAARDLWKSPTAEAWRDKYLSKGQAMGEMLVPRVSEIGHRIDALDEMNELVDVDLCYAVLLHGFWGQINAYRDSVRFYIPAESRTSISGHGKRNSTHRLWLASQHQELYRDVGEFSTMIQSYRLPSHFRDEPSIRGSPSVADSRDLVLVAELFQMILHVSLDDLQNFAGKSGEEEARRATAYLEDSWVTSSEARHAAWHAGQVLHHARRMRPASLRNFNAVTVYLASLTLWAYGMLSSNGDHGRGAVTGDRGHGSKPSPRILVLLDGEENQETKAYLQLGRGIPGLTDPGGAQGGVEFLANPGVALVIAQDLLQDNFPVRGEPLPPLVESIGKLLRDLGSGPTGTGKPSRAASENAESLAETTRFVCS